MRIAAFLKAYRTDTRGVSGMLFAGSASALMASAAFAIDLGSMYLAERKLQGLADAVAMSVDESDYANANESGARSMIVQDGSKNVRIVSMTPGIYTPDSSIAAAERFQSTSEYTRANAMKVSLEQDVPLFFGALIVGTQSARVHAEAVATRTNLAAFSISTHVSNLTSSTPGNLLSSLAGTSLGLSNADITALTGNRVDILAVADALSARFALQGQTYDQIFARSFRTSDFLEAVAASTANSSTAAILRGIAANAGTQSFEMAALIDLGRLGESDIHDTVNPVRIDSYTLTRAALQLAQGETYSAQFAVSAAGLTSANLRIAGRNATAHSPMMTITDARDVVIRTGATRVYLDTQVASSISGISSLRVPFYSELAPGEARMTGIACSGSGQKGVTLGVKPSVGSAAIGTVDTSALDDFSAPLPVSSAVLAQTLLLRVNALSDLSLSGNAEQSVFFSLDEIAAGTRKTVGASDMVHSIAGSLVQNSQFTVTALGLGVNGSAVSSAVGTTLSAVAPTIDGILDTALQSAGVQIGVSEVGIDKVRCGVPVVVA